MKKLVELFAGIVCLVSLAGCSSDCVNHSVFVTNYSKEPFVVELFFDDQKIDVYTLGPAVNPIAVGLPNSITEKKEICVDSGAKVISVLKMGSDKKALIDYDPEINNIFIGYGYRSNELQLNQIDELIYQ